MCEEQKKLKDCEGKMYLFFTDRIDTLLLLVEAQEREARELVSKVEHFKDTQEAFATDTIPEDTWQMVM